MKAMRIGLCFVALVTLHGNAKQQPSPRPDGPRLPRERRELPQSVPGDPSRHSMRPQRTATYRNNALVLSGGGSKGAFRTRPRTLTRPAAVGGGDGLPNRRSEPIWGEQTDRMTRLPVERQ